MSNLVFGFEAIDRTKRMIAGGKGANLGELSGIEGIHVPAGFCISIEAFKRIIGESPAIDELLDHLSLLTVEDKGKIVELSATIRRVIEGTVKSYNVQCCLPAERLVSVHGGECHREEKKV